MIAEPWARSPGVRVPPPLIYAAAGLVAWYLNTRLGFTIDGSGAGLIQRVLGWLFTAAGVALVAGGLRTLSVSHTTFDPNGHAANLVVSGPYRWTRNPIYLGFSATFFGITLLVNSGWMIVLLPIVMMIMSGAVIRREELHLSAVFGADYVQYARRVRRWL